MVMQVHVCTVVAALNTRINRRHVYRGKGLLHAVIYYFITVINSGS